jgi:hypothetical protein
VFSARRRESVEKSLLIDTAGSESKLSAEFGADIGTSPGLRTLGSVSIKDLSEDIDELM